VVAVAPDRGLRPAVERFVNHARGTVSGMDDDLLRFASQALRAKLARVLDDGDRDCTELIASCRALSRVFTTGRPMTEQNSRRVAKCLRALGWHESAIRRLDGGKGAWWRRITGNILKIV
jgi:hypothetical protein